jgi:hypothetical protein
MQHEHDGHCNSGNHHIDTEIETEIETETDAEYKHIHSKIQKMTQKQLLQRQEQIYRDQLSSIRADREHTYLELGIINNILK